MKNLKSILHKFVIAIAITLFFKSLLTFPYNYQYPFKFTISFWFDQEKYIINQTQQIYILKISKLL